MNITINTRARRTIGAASLSLLAVLAAACGEKSSAVSTGNSPTTVASQSSTSSAGSSTSANSATEPPAKGLDAVAASTVQIVAKGTFVDPEFGEYEGAGSGTGFVIDPSGIAVTNNHVVAGAGLLQVFVPGEKKPRNARVLGVSECSDLAVIDIEGPNVNALSWSTDKITPGLKVYAAGYPLGDPEYTLTGGIVSKASANGESNWASVDSVLEHDASIQPGNSGGPLVTVDGKVVAINYASGSRTNTDQFFAIEARNARPIIDQLTKGVNVDSLGINGQAVVSDDKSIAGVWVSGVASGSAADKAGIVAGDIVTRVEGVSVATDGTMADYCDVLRSHEAKASMSVEVLRYATKEVLTGQFNGTKLKRAFSFAEERSTVAADGADYIDYTTVSDASGTLSVSVPAQWSDVNGSPVAISGVSSPSLMASSNVAKFEKQWDLPGVQFVTSTALTTYTADQLLDLASRGECTSEGREDYADGAFAGRFETFSNCGGTKGAGIVVAAFPEDRSYVVLIAVQIATDADLKALDTILRTFKVTV
jgi:serine protease Do